MDVDQLIKGIGAAVAMAESQNGCLFPCLTKSEWASWVQAFGSIAAIFGASWAAMRPIKYELKKDKEALKKRRAEAAIIGFSLMRDFEIAKNALVNIRKIIGEYPSGKESQFVTYLTNTLSKGCVPRMDSCLEMMYVCPDFSKNLALAIDSRRQLELHLERCKKSDSIFTQGNANQDEFVRLYINYVDQVVMAFEYLDEFLRSEGMSQRNGSYSSMK